MKTVIALAAALLLAGAAQAHEEIFTTTLSGAGENPPNASLGTGSATITLDLDTLMMEVQVTFADLTTPATASHIHCCTATPNQATPNVGVATQTPSFIGFPTTTSGSYDHVFDMSLASSYNSSFISANGGTVSTAFAALVHGMEMSEAYLNIHTNTDPGGEIRGFLVLQAVPEPATYALMALGLAAVGGAVRRRR